MTQDKVKRIRRITVRLTTREYDVLAIGWHKSTCRDRSEYLRKMILSKPITVRQRNQSLDDLMATLILLRGELNFIGHNYNQVVRKLHQLKEFGHVDNWLIQHDAAWETVSAKISEIKDTISKIDDQWLQS